VPWLADHNVRVLLAVVLTESLCWLLLVLGHSVWSGVYDHVVCDIVLVVDVYNINRLSIFTRRPRLI